MMISIQVLYPANPWMARSKKILAQPKNMNSITIISYICDKEAPAITLKSTSIIVSTCLFEILHFKIIRIQTIQ